MRRARGLSSMLGALILIFIVIAAGAFVYNYVMVSGKNINGGASASISSVALSALPGGGGLLSVSIANTGAVPIFPAVSLYSGGASVFSTGAAGTSSSWSSVFGGAAWHSEGATPYTQTVAVSPGIYYVAVDWVNTGGPGMSAITYSGAQAASSGWQTIGSSSFTESYSTIQANPPDPPGTVGPSGLLPTAMYDYGTPNSYQGNTYLGIVCAPFPAPFGFLSQQGGSLGYAASTYMVFTSSVTFNIETDDAMEVFYQPASVSPGQALSLSFTIPSGIALGGTYSVVLTASSVQGSLGLSQQVVAS